MTRPNILIVIYSQGIHKKPDTIVQARLAVMYLQYPEKMCIEGNSGVPAFHLYQVP